MLYRKSLLTFINEDEQGNLYSAFPKSKDEVDKSNGQINKSKVEPKPINSKYSSPAFVENVLSKIMNELVLIKRSNTKADSRLAALNQALYYCNRFFNGWQDFLEYEDKVKLNKFSNSLKEGFDQPGEEVANFIWSAINRYRASIAQKEKSNKTDAQGNQVTKSEYEMKLDKFIDTQYDTPLYKKLISKGMTPELEKELGHNAQFYKDVLKRMDEKKKLNTQTLSNKEDASKRYQDKLNATGSMINKEEAAGKPQDVAPSDKEANAHGVPGQWRAEDNKVDPREFPTQATMGDKSKKELTSVPGSTRVNDNYDKTQGSNTDPKSTTTTQQTTGTGTPEAGKGSVQGSTRVGDNYPASGPDSNSFTDRVRKKFGDWANSPEAKKITDWSKKWMDRIVSVTKKVGLDSYGKVGAAAIGVIALFWLWRKFKKRGLNESHDYLAEKFIHESDYLLDIMTLTEDQTAQQPGNAMEGSIKAILSKFVAQAQTIVKTIQTDKNMPDDMKQEFMTLASQLNGAALQKLNQQATPTQQRSITPQTSVKAPTQNPVPQQTAIKAPTQNPVPNNTPETQGKASRPK